MRNQFPYPFMKILLRNLEVMQLMNILFANLVRNMNIHLYHRTKGGVFKPVFVFPSFLFDFLS